MKLDLIERLAMGAFVGCFIVMVVMVIFSRGADPSVPIFSGNDVFNAFFGSIVVGWAFSLSGIIYEREDIAFPVQVIFQMLIGMTTLFIVAVYLHWMPVSLGWGPIVLWVLIACAFAAMFWFAFYVYYYLVARDLNSKLKN